MVKKVTSAARTQIERVMLSFASGYAGFLGTSAAVWTVWLLRWLYAWIAAHAGSAGP